MHHDQDGIAFISPFVDSNSYAIGVHSVVALRRDSTWKSSGGFHLGEARAQWP
jgi:hypothetical protein